jgi:hypothetical protein
MVLCDLPSCQHCHASIHLAKVGSGWTWVHLSGSVACRGGLSRIVEPTYAAPPHRNGELLSSTGPDRLPS